MTLPIDDVPIGKVVLPTPIPLTLHQRSPYNPFPCHGLTGTLRQAVEAIVDLIQCPYELAVNSVLGAASLAVQAHADVVIPATNQIRPLSLFLLSIAKSSERKTSADDEAMKAVKEHEHQLNERYSADLPVYNNRAKAIEVEKARILKSTSLDVGTKSSQLDALHLPPKPLWPYVTCSDPTIEGLLTMFLHGQPSLGLFSSEGGTFTGGHGMNDESTLRTISTLSLLWDGKPIPRTRAAKDETYTLYQRRLAMHLMVQPMVAEDFLTRLKDQGLHSRLLISQPESTMGQRFQRDVSNATLNAIDCFRSYLLCILRQPLPLVQGKQNELAPRALKLDPAAVEAWCEYADDVEARLSVGGRYEEITAFAGKLAEHVCRIAGVMALVEHGPSVESISLDILKKAILIADYYAQESLNLTHVATLHPEIRNAQKMLDWLQNDWEGSYITERDIRQYGPNAFRQTRELMAVMTTLFHYQWLYRIDHPIDVRGRKTKNALLILRKG